jgi:DNA replication factor GINS
MKLDELRTVQSKERRKDSLQQLRDSFYEDVAAFIQDLKASRDRRADQVSDPFSDDEVRRMSDELETAEEVAEAIYERRVGKVVKLASFAAAEMPVDDEGMTTEERALFDDLVDRIKQNKHTVLDILSGHPDSTETTETEVKTMTDPAASTASASQTPTDSVGESTREPEPDVSSNVGSQPEPAEASDSVLADAMGSTTESTADADHQPEPPAEPAATAETTEPDAMATVTDTDNSHASPTESAAGDVPPPTPEPEPEPELEPEAESETVATPTTTTDSTAVPTADTDDTDRTTVRMMTDVGEIFCVDGREYTLQREDVVTLPTANADPLVDRDAAVRLE